MDVMDEDNRSEPAVRDVDIMTSDDITTIVTQLADVIPSSESEDDELERIMRVMKSKETQLRLERRMEDIGAAFNDQEFKLIFRISRNTFEYILGIITPILKSAHGRTTLEKQLLITLFFMATSDSYKSMCHKFGVTQTTVFRSVTRVLKALCNLKSKFITWPSGCNIIEIQQGFKAISGLPNAIGVIDSTHIPISPYFEPPPEVLCDNHKDENSIQLQVVCDHNARFIHCFICEKSALHQEVFKSPELKEWLGNDEKFPTNCYILGDATYKLHEKVIVPYHDNGHLTSEQEIFNICHSVARVAVKNAFRLLKTRFCRMMGALKMKKMDSKLNFVTACCVIHNICLSNGDEIEYCLIDDAAEYTPFHQDTESPEARNRDEICDMLPIGAIFGMNNAAL